MRRSKKKPQKTTPEKLPSRPAGASHALAEAVFRQYHHKLHGYLMRRMRTDKDAAKDLAQEVYIRLMRVDSPELLRNPQGYLYKIASHVVYEQLLSEERGRINYDSDLTAQLTENSQEFICEDAEDQVNHEGELSALLEAVPPMQCAVFILHKRDGWSYEEVATKLRVSVHTVKKYLFLASRQLRAITDKR